MKRRVAELIELCAVLAFFLLLSLVVFLGEAKAQAAGCKSDEACISWRRPTTAVNHATGEIVPIPASTPLTYNIWRAAKGNPHFQMVGQTSQTGAKLLAQPRGEQCYAVTAVMAGAESELSEDACKVIRPRAPTDGRIERPTDGAIER